MIIELYMSSGCAKNPNMDQQLHNNDTSISSLQILLSYNKTMHSKHLKQVVLILNATLKICLISAEFVACSGWKA